MNPCANRNRKTDSKYEEFLDFIENAYVICDDNRKKELISQLIDLAIEENIECISFREKISNISGSEVKSLYTINLLQDMDITAVKKTILKSEEIPIHEYTLEQHINGSNDDITVSNEFKERFFDNSSNISRIINECEGNIVEYFLDENGFLFDSRMCFTLSEVRDKKIEPLDLVFVLDCETGSIDKTYSDITKVDDELLRNFNIINSVVKEKKDVKTKVIK